jgi:hypothetical protein
VVAIASKAAALMAMRIMQSVRSVETGDNGIEAVAASLTNHAAASTLRRAETRPPRVLRWPP